MSILALNIIDPSGCLPSRISRNHARCSSVDLSRHGEFFPGSVRDPRLIRISSGVCLST